MSTGPVVSIPDVPAPAVRALTVLHPSLAARYVALVARVAGAVEAGLSPAVAANRVAASRERPPMLRLEPWRRERRVFAARLRRLAGSERCVVFADVRDCYGRIEPGVVERALRRLGCDAVAARAVRAFLDRLASGGVRGLPVGPDASAVLANAVLAGADAALRSAGVRHLRWVDDVVAGTTDRGGAERVLQILRAELGAAGLELNDAKTRIVTDPSALRPVHRVSATWRDPPVG